MSSIGLPAASYAIDLDEPIAAVSRPGIQFLVFFVIAITLLGWVGATAEVHRREPLRAAVVGGWAIRLNGLRRSRNALEIASSEGR